VNFDLLHSSGLIIMSVMSTIPNADSSPEIVLDWLHNEGWSLKHANVDGQWQVTGSKGAKYINAIGATLEEAWLRATEKIQEACAA
jgi:hypothetical protein